MKIAAKVVFIYLTQKNYRFFLSWLGKIKRILKKFLMLQPMMAQSLWAI